ncbi:MAG TPA: S41 family peptidase [Enterococcus columbae]|nr:S41 family peptidase [Enterococcus columbae]
MNHSKKIVWLCVLSAISAAILAGGGVFLVMRQNQDHQLAKITNVYQDIQKNYYEQVDQKKLSDGAIKGMLAALDDPYTTFLDSSQSEEFNQQLSSEIGGIGATITKKQNHFLLMEEPSKETPAFKAGLQAGDEIISVNQQPVTNLSLKELVDKVRGKKGTKVVLQIKRDSQLFTVSLTRDKIHISSVSSLIDVNHPAVAKIQIKTFSSATSEDLKKEVKTLRKKNVQQFILDLRQNNGGFLIEGERVASMFLKNNQVIAKLEEKGQIVETIKAGKTLDNGFKITEPTIVLVDGQTASSAEIVAAALNESGDKILVGQQTFGKGTVQSINHLDNQSEIKLSTQKWLTPKNRWIHQKGLTPTIKVNLPTAQQLNVLNNSLSYDNHYSDKQKKLLISLMQFIGYDLNLQQFDQTFKQALTDIQSKNQLNITGEIDQATIEKLNELIFAKYLKEDLAYEMALGQLIKA